MKDMLEAGVLDTYLGKYWAVKLATNAAVTVLRVDQVRGRGSLALQKCRFRVAHWLVHGLDSAALTQLRGVSPSPERCYRALCVFIFNPESD